MARLPLDEMICSVLMLPVVTMLTGPVPVMPLAEPTLLTMKLGAEFVKLT